MTKLKKFNGKADVSEIRVAGNTPDTPGIDPASEQAIAERAYQLWLDRGSRIGSSDEDWFEAERELRARSAGEPSVVR
jgi:hypothetical protein